MAEVRPAQFAETAIGLLSEDRLLTGAGVHDGLSGIVASRFGFDFLWLSSFGLSASLGLPDAGVIDSSNVLTATRVIRRSSRLPLVVDLDNGHGSPYKIYSTIGDLEAKADGVCIEDSGTWKTCSLYVGYDRTLASVEEHADRVRAARVAADERGAMCAVIARTEALVAGLDVAAAIERCEAYVEAGADAVFVQCTSSAEPLLAFCARWERRTPVFVAPTSFTWLSKSTVADAGASHLIFANHGLRAAHAAMEATYAHLASAPSAEPLDALISAVSRVAEDVGEHRLTTLKSRLARRVPMDEDGIPDRTRGA